MLSNAKKNSLESIGIRSARKSLLDIFAQKANKSDFSCEDYLKHQKFQTVSGEFARCSGKDKKLRELVAFLLPKPLKVTPPLIPLWAEE